MTELNEPIESAEAPGGSRGVAVTNWLMSKASGILERKASRRGFLVGSAVLGSAVAVAGADPLIKSASAYTYISNCGSSFCTDGWTEFCCALTSFNTCPPGTFPAGWWRADYSSFCNGTRYYIDCNQSCCGPRLSNGFCAGCEECRCAGGCDTRRVYCNYFRYGQCHTEVPLSQTGPIACRVVTCVPPYEWDPACVNSPAVDNATAEHAPNALFCFEPTPPPPPKPPAAAVLVQSCAAVKPGGSGDLLVAARGLDGATYTRTLVGDVWSSWQSLGGAATSGLSLAAASSADYLAVRGTDNAIWVQRRVGGSWLGGIPLGGASRSDPFVVADGSAVQVFVRGADDVPYVNTVNGASSSGWRALGGAISSDPVAVWDGPTLRLVARGLDNSIYEKHAVGGVWSDWNALGGLASSNPAVASDSTGAYVFVRGWSPRAVFVNHFDGSSWSGWASLGGAGSSDPSATSGQSGVRVFIRGLDNVPYENRLSGGAWTGWRALGGAATASPASTSGGSLDHVFVRGNDYGLYYGSFDAASWSGWHSLGGAIASLNAGL